MTPLAFELLKDLTTPGAFRVCDGSKSPSAMIQRAHAIGWIHTDRRDFLRAVSESHFFDLTGVNDIVTSLATKLRHSYEHHDVWSSRLAFLPATNVWIEMDSRAYYIEAAHSQHDAHFAVIAKLPNLGDAWLFLQQGPLALVGDNKKPDKLAADHRVDDYIMTNGAVVVPKGSAGEQVFKLYAALAIINTPRIIGRRQHMPHERVEREKLKSLGLVGKFPLRAWTEILLEVSRIDDRTGDPSTEAHLTGEKCLHFCRSHLRVRLGQLEYVDAHWRGNPALGFKRSRYRLVSDHQGTE